MALIDCLSVAREARKEKYIRQPQLAMPDCDVLVMVAVVIPYTEETAHKMCGCAGVRYTCTGIRHSLDLDEDFHTWSVYPYPEVTVLDSDILAWAHIPEGPIWDEVRE